MCHWQTRTGALKLIQLRNTLFFQAIWMLFVGVTGTMEMYSSLWNRTLDMSDMNTFQTHTRWVWRRGRGWFDTGGKLIGQLGGSEWKWREEFLFLSSASSQSAPGYLVSTFPDEGGEFGHHQVHAFQAGLFQFANLLFHYSLKSQVRGEQPRSEGGSGWCHWAVGGEEVLRC